MSDSSFFTLHAEVADTAVQMAPQFTSQNCAALNTLACFVRVVRVEAQKHLNAQKNHQPQTQKLQIPNLELSKMPSGMTVSELLLRLDQGLGFRERGLFE